MPDHHDTADNYLKARRNYILSCWGQVPVKEIAKALDISRQRVTQIAQSLQLPRSDPNITTRSTPNHLPPAPPRPESFPIPTGLSATPGTRKRRRTRHLATGKPRPAPNPAPKPEQPPSITPATRRIGISTQPRLLLIPTPPRKPSSPIPREEYDHCRSTGAATIISCSNRLLSSPLPFLPSNATQIPDSIRTARTHAFLHGVLERLSAAYATRNAAPWRSLLSDPTVLASISPERWIHETPLPLATILRYAGLLSAAGAHHRTRVLFSITPSQWTATYDRNRVISTELRALLSCFPAARDHGYKARSATDALLASGSPRAVTLAPLLHACATRNPCAAAHHAQLHHRFLLDVLSRTSNAADTSRACLDCVAAGAISLLPKHLPKPVFPLFDHRWIVYACANSPVLHIPAPTP